MATSQFGNKALRWIGTITCLVGIVLNAFNIYPLNIILQGIGSAFWAWAGIQVKDVPLVLVESVAVITYICGLIYAVLILNALHL